MHKSLLSQKEFNQEFDEKSDEESNEETNEERKSQFNIRFYSFVAHHSQYPYHVNTVFLLAYNNYILVVYNFKDNICI